MTNEQIKKLDALVYKLAYTFTSDKTIIEDLYQQGVIGILKAQQNYNVESNAKFSTYAKMYIYGEMYNYYNSLNKDFKISKETIKTYKLIKFAKEYLTQELKKDPSVTEISKYLNIDESTIFYTLKSMDKVLSINYTYEDSSLENFIISSDEYKTLEINELLSELDDNQRKVIMYKYFEGYSQEEIAKIMNISQSSVSRCEHSGISRMRKKTIS